MLDNYVFQNQFYGKIFDILNIVTDGDFLLQHTNYIINKKHNFEQKISYNNLTSEHQYDNLMCTRIKIENV